jgi:hypothetical protein
VEVRFESEPPRREAIDIVIGGVQDQPQAATLFVGDVPGIAISESFFDG